jgi:hypothetical protein
VRASLREGAASGAWQTRQLSQCRLTTAAHWEQCPTAVALTGNPLGNRGATHGCLGVDTLPR